MDKESSLNKGNTERRKLGHKGEKITEQAKLWVNSISFISPVEFSTLCLMAETKIIKLPEMVLNVWRGNSRDDYKNKRWRRMQR